jgi:hypothetical protein
VRTIASVAIPDDDVDTLVDVPGVIPELVDDDPSGGVVIAAPTLRDLVPRTVTQPIGSRARRVVVRGRGIVVHL